MYDALPDILWGKYLLEAQGHKIDHNVLLQDNTSTILLPTNGMMSSSKKTKHIRHRFFLIKDRVESGDVEIKYEPTGGKKDRHCGQLHGYELREHICPIIYMVWHHTHLLAWTRLGFLC